MRLRSLLLFTTIVFCPTLFAQDLAGVWEGSFFLNGNKKQKMNVRVELMETDGEYLGIVYSRGYDQNTSFGCDYLVSGRMYNGKISLVRKEVMRGVAMPETDCAFFEELYLTLPKNDPGKQVKGKWYWRSEKFDFFSASKTDSVISELTKDEIVYYIRELYDQFEKDNVVLKPESRLFQKAGELEVDSSDILLEFTSIEGSIHDSIIVLFNGEEVAISNSLAKRPLRIRIKETAPGLNDIIVISQSIAQNKLKIRLQVKQQQQTQEFTLEPGFVSNSLLLLKRKEN